MCQIISAILCHRAKMSLLRYDMTKVATPHCHFAASRVEIFKTTKMSPLRYDMAKVVQPSLSFRSVSRRNLLNDKDVYTSIQNDR